MTNSNTDVPASIAGYFYQFLLAVQELSNLLSCGHADDTVGIEQGADVRVIKQGNKKKSLEAKFYKDTDFNRKHSSICHTLYNFYSSFLVASDAKDSIDNYEYHTNVPITAADKQFFDRWNTPNSWTDKETKEFITYIKEAIVQDRLKTKRAIKIIPQMEEYLQEIQINKVLIELIDGTSPLIAILQQTEKGKATYECLKGTNQVTKKEKLNEVIKTFAYTKPRSKERIKIRPIIENLQTRIKKTSREQLIAAFLNGEIPASYSSIISYKVVDAENGAYKKRDCVIDLTKDEYFESFARKLNFHFGAFKKTKISYIIDLQKSISQQLQKYDSKLQRDDCQKIINALIERLFRTTTLDDIPGITVGELKELIQHHNEILENKKLSMIMESYENAINGIRRVMRRVMGEDTARRLEQSILEVWEQYYKSAELMGLSELNKRFKVNQNEISIEELLEILIHISLLEHFGEQHLSVSFMEEIMDGVNNVELAANKQYLFKLVKGTFYMKAEDVLYDFIDYMYKNHIEKIAGNENVLFFSDVASPTNINIEDYPFILNIARVEEQENLQLLFGDMNFSWNKQIDLREPHEKNKLSALNFLGD